MKQHVQEYYGKTLQHSDDLKTSACCPIDAMPSHILPYLKQVHSEVQERFYGCGSPLPHVLEGKTVLDLGCGTGRDCYILAQMVGSKGQVIGVDMTAEQLAVAQTHLDYHRERFGYEQSNVTFLQGHIEDLAALGIEDHSVDVVVSNCVINLADDKERVFSEIFRVLKPGGELYFSDIFTDRRVPEALTRDPVLVGECLGGALYSEDFRRLIARMGCLDYRIVSQSKVELDDAEVVAKAGMIGFYSMTVSAFALDLEDICENYGHVAYYKGSIAHCPHAFKLDDHHVFNTGLPYPVCGNTAKMLSQTRYKEHFQVEGDFSTHYGVFDCTPPADHIQEKGCC